MFCFNDTSTPDTSTYCHTLSLHDAFPILLVVEAFALVVPGARHVRLARGVGQAERSDDARHRVARAAGIQATARIAVHQRRLQGQQLVGNHRSEEHTSELQSLMRISYAVFRLKKQKPYTQTLTHHI